jgi:hypothetical protein
MFQRARGTYSAACRFVFVVGVVVESPRGEKREPKAPGVGVKPAPGLHDPVDKDHHERTMSPPGTADRVEKRISMSHLKHGGSPAGNPGGGRTHDGNTRGDSHDDFNPIPAGINQGVSEVADEELPSHEVLVAGSIKSRDADAFARGLAPTIAPWLSPTGITPPGTRRG